MNAPIRFEASGDLVGSTSCSGLLLIVMWRLLGEVLSEPQHDTVRTIDPDNFGARSRRFDDPERDTNRRPH